jgi:hypothetical protein
MGGDSVHYFGALQTVPLLYWYEEPDALIGQVRFCEGCAS